MSRRRHSLSIALAFVVGAVAAAFAGTGATLQIVPTTTLAAETGNNTSTAATFATQTNGNLG
ncbi:MAG TPA: hypothetical protein VE998_01835, partial [Terriglobales bacterium]|nr:hypothetical protein [Terriglobales bacterium]